MTTPCHPGHEHLVDADDLVRQNREHQLRRRQWRALYDDSEAADSDATVGAVAHMLRADDPAASMKALRDELPDLARADAASKLQAESSQRAQILAPLITPPDSDRLSRFARSVCGTGWNWRQVSRNRRSFLWPQRLVMLLPWLSAGDRWSPWTTPGSPIAPPPESTRLASCGLSSSP
jgi:hypothetical protein